MTRDIKIKNWTVEISDRYKCVYLVDNETGDGQELEKFAGDFVLDLIGEKYKGKDK